MRKYLKPAFEMEAFDLEDVITLSGPTIVDNGSNGQSGGSTSGDGDQYSFAGAPIDLINLN